VAGDPQGLVTFWDLADAVAGGTAFGWGPWGNHGTFVGGLTFGGAAGLGFDGLSGHVMVPHGTGSLEIGTHPEVVADNWAVWVRFRRGPLGAVRTLIAKGGSSSYCLRIDATGHLQIVDGGIVTLTDPTVLDTNVHQVLAGRAQNQTSMFVDGTYRGVATTTTGTPASGPAIPAR